MMMLGNAVSLSAQENSTKTDTAYRLGFWKEKGWLCICLSTEKTESAISYEIHPSETTIFVPVVNTVKVTYSENRPWVRLVPGLGDICQSEIDALFKRGILERTIYDYKFNLLYSDIRKNIFFLKETNPYPGLKYEIAKENRQDLFLTVISHILFFFFILSLYWSISSFWDKYKLPGIYIRWGFVTIIMGSFIGAIIYFVNILVFVNLTNLGIFIFFFLLGIWKVRKEKEKKKPMKTVFAKGKTTFL